MGTNIDREAFDEVDDARFQQRLEQCLSTLGELLERPGFGVGPATIGAELELFLVDEMARPLPHNQAVRAAAADARVNVELDRFNLELNATPTLLAGRPFAAFGEGVQLHQPLLPVLGDHDPLAGMEEGQAPPLQELRLHQGTVWRWNRAVYDPASGGHLRIEMRALPSGPTVTDMLANAALLVGLSLWLAEQDPSWTYALSFERAEHGFYRAAQQGLAAELTWPLGHGGRLDTRRAAELVPELLPAARQGLVRAGVAAAEADRLLGVIAARVATGQTGAVWQRRTLAALEPRLGRERALAA